MLPGMLQRDVSRPLSLNFFGIEILPVAENPATASGATPFARRPNRWFRELNRLNCEDR